MISKKKWSQHNARKKRQREETIQNKRLKHTPTVRWAQEAEAKGLKKEKKTKNKQTNKQKNKQTKQNKKTGTDFMTANEKRMNAWDENQGQTSNCGWTLGLNQTFSGFVKLMVKLLF